MSWGLDPPPGDSALQSVSAVTAFIRANLQTDQPQLVDEGISRAPVIMRRLTEFMRRVFAAVTLGALLLSLCQRARVEGHGRLIDPPSRASMWRFGFNTNANYDDNQGYCGGREVSGCVV